MSKIPSFTTDDWIASGLDQRRFELRSVIGKGSYGSVAEGLDHSRSPPLRIVAKCIHRPFNSPEDAKRILRELQILRWLSENAPHRNLLKILHIPVPQDPFRSLVIVCEALDTDLERLGRDVSQMLTMDHCRWFLKQLLRGVGHLHSFGLMHRDIKPGNIFLSLSCSLTLGDFSLARSLYRREGRAAGDSTREEKADDEEEEEEVGEGRREKGEEEEDEEGEGWKYNPFSPLIMTRWYRAPEVLLYGAEGLYDERVDLWSIGAVFAELLGMCEKGLGSRGPLFPGGSDEMTPRQAPSSSISASCASSSSPPKAKSQLRTIMDAIGSPPMVLRAQTEGARTYLSDMPQREPTDLRLRYPSAPKEALELLRAFLSFDPSDRPTCAEALKSPFFDRLVGTEDGEEGAAPPKIAIPLFEEIKSARDAAGLFWKEIAPFNPEWKERAKPPFSILWE